MAAVTSGEIYKDAVKTVLGTVKLHQAVLAPVIVHKIKAPGRGEHPALSQGGMCGKGVYEEGVAPVICSVHA